jgi:colicin import membrane protein
MILDKPEEPGKKYALTFTILVHVGLIAALFLGVQWKRSQPEVMEVELWAARPMPAQVVPPPPPPPEVKPEPKPLPKVEPKPEPLPPKKPDIAIKEEKKKPEPKKPEPPKPEPKKPEPKPEVKPPPKLPDFSKELSRETADLKPRPNTQQMANAAAAETEQRAASNKRGLADYASKIRGKVRGNIVLPPGIQGNPEAVFEVSQLPSGEVLDVKLKRSSGNPALDSAIERALRKSSPLPKPDDPSLFQRTLEIKYKPFEE